jgi:hypothetical protein
MKPLTHIGILGFLSLAAPNYHYSAKCKKASRLRAVPQQVGSEPFYPQYAPGQRYEFDTQQHNADRKEVKKPEKSFFEWKPKNEKQDKSKNEEKVVGGNVQGEFGKVEDGIGSWFRANHGHDDTNGNSWCGYPYKDYTNGFAPSLSRMTEGTNAKWGHGDWEKYGKKYCGREAIVTNMETGAKKLMYIVDAFDDRWVKTPGSIDIMVKSFQELTGDYSGNKNNVVKIKWELTGNINEKYAFNGPGDQ